MESAIPPQKVVLMPKPATPKPENVGGGPVINGGKSSGGCMCNDPKCPEHERNK